jgi:hypothetical protein
MLTGLACLTIYGVCAGTGSFRNQDASIPAALVDKPVENAKPDLAATSNSEDERNAKLAKYLTQTRWTGKFTISEKEDGPLIEEQYEIIEATKDEQGDLWNLVARIKYGEKDVTLPLPSLEIKWAGETPVITVDKMTIPGMGIFDARVLIRKGQYAGTWAHGAVGGHLFGKIEKIEEKEKPKQELQIPKIKAETFKRLMGGG